MQLEAVLNFYRPPEATGKPAYFYVHEGDFWLLPEACEGLAPEKVIMVPSMAEHHKLFGGSLRTSVLASFSVQQPLC